ncbi:uncharacterized protein LOC112146158 [Oryzias melastigma]|uniref:uncharacterized protein LOC112146158 n=1 Tax=Oryzias melastigma TaxID=30732 RepID=UPI00168D3134|nr:uncharacterized protein LOC112146158 [Oryzias melastigma]
MTYRRLTQRKLRSRGGTGAATRCPARRPARRLLTSCQRRTVFTEELTFETDTLKDTSEGEGRSLAAGDSGLPLSLDSPSLNLLDAKEEREEEPMDCSSSPDTQDASSPYSKPPTPPSQSSTPFQPSTPPLSNGWGSAVSNGPPCLPPLPSLDNHNVVVSRPLGWTAAAKSPNNNSYHSPPSDPAGSSLFGSGSGQSLDQEEVISCPGCYVPQHWLTEDEDFCNQQRTFSGEKEEPELPKSNEEPEDPEPPQIEEELGELRISQDEEQLYLSRRLIPMRTMRTVRQILTISRVLM